MENVIMENAGHQDITLEDLLNAESEVLRRIGDEQSSSGTTMSGHYSSTGGHSSSGGHTSHTSARIEKPLSPNR